MTAWSYEVLTELYAHAEQQPPPQSRESVIDLVRRRMVETDPANKKH